MMINISQTPEILRNNMEILVLRAFQLTETQTRSLALSHALSLSCSLALLLCFLLHSAPLSISFSHTLAFATPCKSYEKARSRKTLSGNTIR